MQIIKDKVTLEELTKMSAKMFGGLVKAVVDVEKHIMAVDAELHADEEQALLEQDSQQEHLWGINIYPEKIETHDFIEFDSMINLRPSWGNKSRGVDSRETQEKIKTIVNNLIVK